MKRSTKLSGVLAAALLLTMVIVPVDANEEEGTVTTRLSGYQETPLTINSTASGEFTARIRDGGTAIVYELTYRLPHPVSWTPARDVRVMAPVTIVDPGATVRSRSERDHRYAASAAARAAAGVRWPSRSMSHSAL